MYSSTVDAARAKTAKKDSSAEVTVGTLKDLGVSDDQYVSMRARLKEIDVSSKARDPICAYIDMHLYGKRVSRRADRQRETWQPTDEQRVALDRVYRLKYELSATTMDQFPNTPDRAEVVMIGVRWCRVRCLSAELLSKAAQMWASRH
jgi:hypothetical protein